MTRILNEGRQTLKSIDNKSDAPETLPCDHQSATGPSAEAPTPTLNTQSQRLADFDTLIDALDYAAHGITGYNFYDARGKLRHVLSYSDLRDKARAAARRLLTLDVQRGDHVAIIADTSPDFVTLFFACRYAGLVPFAMPVPVNLGSHEIYVQQLRSMLTTSEAKVALANVEFINFLEEAAEGLEAPRWTGTPGELEKLAEADSGLRRNTPDEIAYLQFTSGSTRNPQAVMVTERAAMSNLQGIVRNGLEMQPDDRCASWLPFYHDMGLIGLVMSPLVAQLSVDYLGTRDFAIRPMQWLRLISNNRCTIAFSQPFGFKLCTLRVRNADLEDLDLSCWRAAGVGAEMIRPDILRDFAEKFAPTGFSADAFLPCYGLAEATLAVTFAPINNGVQSMHIDGGALTDRAIAVQVRADGRKYNEFVNCGQPLPGHMVKVVDDEGRELPDFRVGSVLMSGPSIMTGYYNNSEATENVLQYSDWLDTGDLGFIREGSLYITGRRTDVIIINGRNIRAQDIEALAEEQPEVRTRQTSAFSISDENGNTTIVLVIECRLSSQEKRQSLTTRLQRLVYSAFGVRCLVELVPPHTLPRTSSGKLSRTAARKGFMERTSLINSPSAQSYNA
jgi:fatty-acyl-CoA synthase